MEDMLAQRREWVNEFKATHNNKIPEDVKPYYEKLNTQTPLSPEEEAAKKAEDEEAAAGKKAKKAAGAKKGGKKKGGKKKAKGDGEEKQALVKIGPTEVVSKFDLFYDEFNEDWVNRDETTNQS